MVQALIVTYRSSGHIVVGSLGAVEHRHYCVGANRAAIVAEELAVTLRASLFLTVLAAFTMDPVKAGLGSPKKRLASSALIVRGALVTVSVPLVRTGVW